MSLRGNGFRSAESLHQDLGLARIGRFEVLGSLGRGGMAQVLRVRDPQTNEIAALKLAVLDGRSVELRLKAEAAAMEVAAHPNIPRLLEVGTDERLRPYLVMELARRGSLAEALQGRGPLATDEVAGVGVQVSAALAAAHAHGIVHRDVKPGNLLLAADGRVLLADFGIAHVPSCPIETSPNAVLGSVAFMAPEQRERPDRPIVASDQYALGATLYALSTGHRPGAAFPDDDPLWDSVPEALRPILYRATRPDPFDRYPSVRAMAGHLSRLVVPRLWLTQPHLAEWLAE